MLIFLPGIHSHKINLFVTNITKLSILSNCTWTSCVTIVCDLQHNSTFKFVNTSEVHITGIDFYGCQDHEVKQVSQYTLENAVFSNHNGTAIHLSNCRAHIIRSSFISYAHQKPGSYFKRTPSWHGRSVTSEPTGATIAITRSNFTATESTFEGYIGGTIIAQHHSNLTIINSMYVDNAGGVLYSEGGCNVVILNSTFHNNAADRINGVFNLHRSIISFQQCTFTHNTAKRRWRIIVVVETNVMIVNSKFRYNGLGDEVIIYAVDARVVINASSFEHNGAVCDAATSIVSITFSEFESNMRGVIRVRNTRINIENSRFTNNSAMTSWYGGVMWATSANVSIRDSNFNNNTAFKGGVLEANRVNLYIIRCEFTNNSAFWGGVLRATTKSFVRTQDIHISDNKGSQGIMHFVNSAGVLYGKADFLDNKGSLIAHYSNLTFNGNATLVKCSPLRPLNDIIIYNEAGVITAFQSFIFFKGKSTLMHNTAENGGAIYATESKLYVYGELKFANNTATKNGGGVYLYQSEVNCQEPSILILLGNSANERGGGIHMISSIIRVRMISSSTVYKVSSVQFNENTARQGGGLCLESNAKLHILRDVTDALQGIDRPPKVLTFNRNSAHYGGAVYVADDTNSATCASTSYREHLTNTECFLQTLALQGKSSIVETLLNKKFNRNRASISGSCLFGGVLDRCTVSTLGETYEEHTLSSAGLPDGIKYLKIVSNIHSLKSISSDPVLVCFCNGGQPDCNYQPPLIKLKKGEMFTVQLVAVDQVNNTVSNVSIRSTFNSVEGGFGEGQLIQQTADSCTNLTFNVFSPQDYETLIMYAEGPCKDAKLSRRSVEIKFDPCSCPIGLQPIKEVERTNCKCECDKKLDEYITRCDPQTGTLERDGDFWIMYVNDTNKSLSDYVIHPHCPFDYCKPAGSKVEINLHISHGTDTQCANNRSGALCGSCLPGLSLSIGSSRCILCPSYWPAVFVTVLIAAFLAGIVLVALLLVLNLTVAVGTLNGIIFYANVVAVSSSTFLPISRPNFATVFISWLNLDLGLDACLFEGTNVSGDPKINLLIIGTVIVCILLLTIIIATKNRVQKMDHRNP